MSTDDSPAEFWECDSFLLGQAPGYGTPLSLQEALHQVRTLLQSGACAEAKSLCQSILIHAPNCPDAYRFLGAAEFHLGDPVAAIHLLERAIQLDPIAEFYDNLSVILYAQGRFCEAEEAARKALALDSSSADAANSLGRALLSQNRLASAEAAFRNAIGLRSEFSEAHANLSNVLLSLGRYKEAEEENRTALAIGPRQSQLLYNLARSLSSQRRFNEAFAVLRETLTLEPNHANALSLLGAILNESYRFAEAETVLRSAAKCHCSSDVMTERCAEAVTDLACLFFLQGNVEEAAVLFRQVSDLYPQLARASRGLLEAEQYRDSATSAQLAEMHAAWGRRIEVESGAEANSNYKRRKDPSLLRLGFVSPDLHEHPVGRLLVRWLENLDARRWEIIAYADELPSDNLGHRMARCVREWRIAPSSDTDFRDLIVADAIDILFDLSGHTVGNRLAVFALRAAPLQASWLGYVGTTGLSTMDLLLADRRHVPVDDEPNYLEKVICLPDSYACFDPPQNAPDSALPPVLAEDRITFGCFANPPKIQRRAAAAWSEILRQVPESRLLLKYRAMCETSVQRRILAMFADCGIALERIRLEEGGSRQEMLEAYSRVDIVLDSFPYSGGMTTCEAIWMGVPVITFPGATFAGRHATSHLTAAGLTELIAKDRDDYVRLAIALAGDLNRLALYRRNLRQQVASSPLCDGPRFARNLETALLRVWNKAV